MYFKSTAFFKNSWIRRYSWPTGKWVKTNSAGLPEDEVSDGDRSASDWVCTRLKPTDIVKPARNPMRKGSARDSQPKFPVTPTRMATDEEMQRSPAKKGWWKKEPEGVEPEEESEEG